MEERGYEFQNGLKPELQTTNEELRTGVSALPFYPSQSLTTQSLQPGPRAEQGTAAESESESESEADEPRTKN